MATETDFLLKEYSGDLEDMLADCGGRTLGEILEDCGYMESLQTIARRALAHRVIE